MADRGKERDALSLAVAALQRLLQCSLRIAGKLGGSDVGPSHLDGEIEPGMQARGDTFERASEIDR